MKYINLTRGQTIIDDEDFDWLNQWKWSNNGKNYATRSVQVKRKKTKIYMHRLIMNFPKNMQVDHIDGNPLNNKRENLRICTNTENVRNKKLDKTNTSGYKGVHFYKRDKNWQAYIHVNNKRIHLGYFKTAIEAAKAYNKAALKYFGEFARLNKL